jgi:hypothetical protein
VCLRYESENCVQHGQHTTKLPYTGAIYNATSTSIYVSDDSSTPWGPYNVLGRIDNATLAVTRAGPQVRYFKVQVLNDNTFIVAYTLVNDGKDQFYVSRCFDAACASNSSSIPARARQSTFLTMISVPHPSQRLGD